MNLTNVIKRPLITEKSHRMSGLNRYTFEVDSTANKNQIKQAVELYFSVNVLNVWTVTKPGQIRRTGRRRLPSLTMATKKAIVELAKDQSIPVFETKDAHDQ